MMYQRGDVKLSKRKYEELPVREDVKGEKYVDGQMYRVNDGTDDIVVWVAYDKDNTDAKGEWQRAKVRF